MPNKLRALVLTSDSPRHRFFLRVMSQQFDVVGVITQAKSQYYQDARQSSELIRSHFEQMQRVESKIFAAVELGGFRILQVPHSELNSESTVAWASNLSPDVILLFGTGILGPIWFSSFEGRIINLHLGLSPYYRGSATLFWPFARGELHFLGTTIHLAIPKVDAGEILARVKPDWIEGEDYYLITNKLILKSIEVFPSVVLAYLNGRIKRLPPEDVPSRLFRKADFAESDLKQALKFIGGGISRAAIEEAVARFPCEAI